MIRDATERDADAVARLWNSYIRDTLVTFNAAEKTRSDVVGTIAAAQDDGRAFLLVEGPAGLLGFASYFQFRNGVGYARTMEHSILLDPAARGQGIGRALLTAIEDHARARGAHSLFAGVSSANSEGRAFHAAMGYAERALLPEVGYKWDRWLDLHLMQKIL